MTEPIQLSTAGLPNYLDNYFSKDSISYIKGFVFGDTKSLDEDIVNNLSINGISHLFAISGLHVTIIIVFIEKGLNKTKLQDKTKENIIIVLLSLLFETLKNNIFSSCHIEQEIFRFA